MWPLVQDGGHVGAVREQVVCDVRVCQWAYLLVRTGCICTVQCCLFLAHDAESVEVEIDVPWHRLEVEYTLRHQAVVVEDEGELSVHLHGALQRALHEKISTLWQRGVQGYRNSERNIREGKKRLS